MTMTCTVCNHAQRLEIDRSLVQNKSISSIARKYNLKNDALTRHRRNHLSRQLITSQKQRDIFHGDSMLKLIQDLLTSSQNILQKCENKPSRFPVALKAIAESRRTVEFLWEISVKLQEVKIEEKRINQQEGDMVQIWAIGCQKASQEDLQTLADLTNKVMALGSGKRPGRRTDLERKKRARIAQDKHRRKKLLEKQNKSNNPVEPVKRKLKRRKLKPKPIDEFEKMRLKYGICDDPSPPKPRAWTDPDF